MTGSAALKDRRRIVSYAAHSSSNPAPQHLDTMLTLSQTAHAQEWLARFTDRERESASELVDEMLLVSGDQFRSRIDAELARLLAQAETPIALYAERPVKVIYGTVPAFFRDSRHGRAEGTGVQPVVADPRNQEVGSEGVVANLVTDFCRRNPATCFSHPGPTLLRRRKVRQIVIVTDFIGSGQRITRMLESLRYVATLRSWRSYGLIRFHVVAYSGIEQGIERVKRHKLKPELWIRGGCPTLEDAFSGRRLRDVSSLCRAYPPGHIEPLGYQGGGALIAFAHGCPNNVPPILHSRASGWTPLFMGRSTQDVLPPLLAADDYSALDQRTARLLGFRRELQSDDQDRWVSVLLVLAAAADGSRTPREVSARTHLEVEVVSALAGLAKDARWLDEKGGLTALGQDELRRLRKRRSKKPLVVRGTSEFYYPTQLKAP